MNGLGRSVAASRAGLQNCAMTDSKLLGEATALRHPFAAQRLRGRVVRACVAALVAFAASACRPTADVYTLYRGSVANGIERVHVATFDARHGASYNATNCEVARSLFSTQPGVSVQYWCEPGRARR